MMERATEITTTSPGFQLNVTAAYHGVRDRLSGVIREYAFAA
jgi:hypothetical protein